MITGFTGSSRRMSAAQQAAVVALVIESTELHHGDCVVADEWAHRCAVDLKRRVVIHPPDDPKKRAFCAREYPGEEVTELPTEPYLERNHSIVDASDRLVACPDRAEAEGRAGGGVWATVRHARKRKKPIIIIDVDGNVMEPDALVEPPPPKSKAKAPEPAPEPEQPDAEVHTIDTTKPKRPRKPRQPRKPTAAAGDPEGT